ncbi:PCI domain-containing protein [Bacillota bacterium Lsc_1132]
MEKEKLYQYIRGMIISSTKSPKYMTISTVKVANLLDLSVSEVEQTLKEFVESGKLRSSKLETPPFHEIYLLP